MLAGVGGKTIAEAKANLSIGEFASWMQYRKKYGPFNPMLRIDAAVARLSQFIAATKGAKREVADFMPWPVLEKPSIDEAELASMKKMKRKRKRKKA